MKTLPVGLQLYTVRDKMAENVRETLSQVKNMGYDYVEIAGLFGLTPEQFKNELDNLGLCAMSAHVPIEEFTKDMAGVISSYKTIGVKYIVVPYLAPNQRYGNQEFDMNLVLFNKFADKCKEEGLILLYHNHDFEFVKKPDGEYVLDYIYKSVPEMQSELDTCWVNIGGEDPAKYIRKFKDRCPVVHLKDFVGGKTENMYELLGSDEAKSEKSDEFSMRPVGYGKQDFDAILLACAESGAEYVVVEQDDTNELPSLEAAKISREYLKKLGW